MLVPTDFVVAQLALRMTATKATMHALRRRNHIGATSRSLRWADARHFYAARSLRGRLCGRTTWEGNPPELGGCGTARNMLHRTRSHGPPVKRNTSRGQRKCPEQIFPVHTCEYIDAIHHRQKSSREPSELPTPHARDLALPP